MMRLWFNIAELSCSTKVNASQNIINIVPGLLHNTVCFHFEEVVRPFLRNKSSVTHPAVRAIRQLNFKYIHYYTHHPPSDMPQHIIIVSSTEQKQLPLTSTYTPKDNNKN